MGEPEILVEKSNGLHHSMWETLRRGDAIFLLSLVCLADLDILCSGLFSQRVRFCSVIFMNKISTVIVCVNGKHPWFIIEALLSPERGWEVHISGPKRQAV